ncbi:hypothetical protein FGO68_gene8648 [Halteria grandinella]|uniref:Uncharacterized protein n=1 Tax=Halteria grandinella TaxID=5974 RepID=A0A8J8T6V2_HALGN|nr:hypothetical protein FGO68_gene8648 [Halteria grandinella]
MKHSESGKVHQSKIRKSTFTIAQEQRQLESSFKTTKLSEKKNKTALIKAITSGDSNHTVCLSKAKSMWRSQDLFGKEVQFTFKGKRAYQTSIGALVSVMIKVILGLFIAYEFYVIFSRKHPAIGEIRELERGDGFDIRKGGVQIAFAMKSLFDNSHLVPIQISGDKCASTLIDPKFGSLSATYMTKFNESEKLCLRPCESSDFKGINKEFKIGKQIKERSILCIERETAPDLNVNSPAMSENQQCINIEVNECANSSEVTCHSQDKIQEYLSNLSFQIITQTQNFNFKKFDSMIETYIDEPLELTLQYGQLNSAEISVQSAKTELLDSYFEYWLKKEYTFAQIDSTRLLSTNKHRGQVKIRGSNIRVIYMRVADNIFSGLESIGGFFESLMHIGAIIVVFFQERLFKGSFLKQLYQVTPDVVLTKEINENNMIRIVNKEDKVDKTYIKKVLDFIVLKRERFSYGGVHIVDYLTRCLCLRKSQLHQRENKSHFLYNKGDRKLKQELDIVNLVRQIRQLRLMAQVLLKPSERLLLKFQRKNVIETTSSSSDSDHQNYDTVKLLNSKKGLIKLQQIVKINKMLEQYQNKELRPVERNLFKGIFRRRPSKFVSEEIEPILGQSFAKSEFGSDHTTFKEARNKIYPTKSLREMSYDVSPSNGDLEDIDVSHLDSETFENDNNQIPKQKQKSPRKSNGQEAQSEFMMRGETFRPTRRSSSINDKNPPQIQLSSQTPQNKKYVQAECSHIQQSLPHSLDNRKVPHQYQNQSQVMHSSPTIGSQTLTHGRVRRPILKKNQTKEERECFKKSNQQILHPPLEDADTERKLFQIDSESFRVKDFTISSNIESDIENSNISVSFRKKETKKIIGKK